MPDSQSHRPAVSVNKSSSVRIDKLLERAADLEKQLTSLSKSNDEKAARLRSHLCEILSDILISDPFIGTEKDCTGRLWRSCFYAPIGIWRSRISREKRKQGPNLASLELSFKKFLGEAITLYDYLALQYQTKLLPGSSQGNSQDSTQDFLPSGGSLEGVVPGLFRLYIHMGDLHRYAESFNKAENCYLSASKLAPGMGNPYNQLAVVAQMKDANMSCVALYWYARSLLATHDRFETSSSNLERLFTINRTYLKEHSRDPTPPILPPSAKKTSSDLVRAQKAAASKSCLAHFVDFHYELFKNSETEDAKELLLREKMTAVNKSIQSLLRASAYGDALLCKLVIINIFSFEKNKEGGDLANRQLSSDFLYVLGSSLAERLKHGLSRIVEKSGKLPPSIRFLLPFQILCEFLDPLENKNRGEDENYFWKQYVEVANLALRISQQMNMSHAPSPAAENTHLSLREYQLLKGYRPFSFLTAEYLSQSAYVSPSEAIDVLELTTSQTQESESISLDSNKLKLMRFLQVCNRASQKKTSPVAPSRDGFVFVDRERVMEGAQVEDHAIIKGHSPDEDASMRSAGVEADEAGDVVMFGAREVECTDGLLGNAMMLAANPEASESAETLRTTRSGVQTDVNRGQISSGPQPQQHASSPVLGRASEMSLGVKVNEALVQEHRSTVSPLGITPPPGFGSLLDQSDALRPAACVAQGMSIRVAPSHPGHSAFLTSVPTFEPTPFALSVSSSTLLHQAGPSFMGQHFPTEGHSLQWFGGSPAFQTANPFAAPHENPPTPVYEADPSSVDGASLLGAGLLDSLWMNDTAGGRTNNPFAANHE
jgi:hypothetical protein